MSENLPPGYVHPPDEIDVMNEDELRAALYKLRSRLDEVSKLHRTALEAGEAMYKNMIAAQHRANEAESRLDAARKILETDLVTSGCATCHELGRLLSVSGVEKQCSFSAPVFEDGVHHKCVRMDGHKGPHELEPGHYIHGDECEPLCSDCPPAGYPTDKTRCHKCPRRSSSPPEYAEPPRCGHREGWKVCILPPGHKGGHLSG